MSLLRCRIKTTVSKFAISNHVALKLDIQTLGSYLNLTCEYEPHILSNTKVSGKNYLKVRLPWSAIFCVIVYGAVYMEPSATWILNTKSVRHSYHFKSKILKCYKRPSCKSIKSIYCLKSRNAGSNLPLRGSVRFNILIVYNYLQSSKSDGI